MVGHIPLRELSPAETGSSPAVKNHTSSRRRRSLSRWAAGSSGVNAGDGRRSHLTGPGKRRRTAITGVEHIGYHSGRQLS